MSGLWGDFECGSVGARGKTRQVKKCARVKPRSEKLSAQNAFDTTTSFFENVIFRPLRLVINSVQLISGHRGEADRKWGERLR